MFPQSDGENRCEIQFPISFKWIFLFAPSFHQQTYGYPQMTVPKVLIQVNLNLQFTIKKLGTPVEKNLQIRYHLLANKAQ